MSLDAAPPIAATRVRRPELTFGPFVFDPDRRLLRREDKEVPLPPRVIGVLELLIARAGDVVSRQELTETVWKEAFVTDTSLAEAISYLRQALGDDSQAPTYVQTVHRRGYRFVAPVSTVSPVTSTPSPTPAPIDPTRQTASDDRVKPSIVNELLPWSIAILSVVAALSAIWYATRRETVIPPIIRLPIGLERGAQFDNRAPAIALSRSAARIAWSACPIGGACRLYLRDLETLHEREIPQTENAAAPFFSPDESWLGFFADGKLKKVFLRGGAPMTIADAPQPYGATWMPDGRIVFAASIAGGLQRVREQGGEIETLTRPSADLGELRHAFPSATRDGAGVFFTVVTSPLPAAPGRLALMPYSPRQGRGSWRVIAEGADAGGAIGDEYVAFVRNDEVHAVSFDPLRQAASGLEQVVEQGVMSPHIATSASGAMAAAGMTFHEPSVPVPPLWSWVTGRATHALGRISVLRHPAVSPDGRHVAGLGEEPRPDVWIVNLEHGTSTRLTYSGPNARPVWDPAGRDVFYAARRDAGFEIRARPAAGGDERLVLSRKGRHVFPSSVTPIGQLAFVETGGDTRSDVGVMRIDDPSSARLVVQTGFDEVAPALSPNGELMAYQTDESGQWQIAVLRTRDGRRTPVSSGGGTAPFWSVDGRTLFFEAQDTLKSLTLTRDGEATGPAATVARLNGASVAGITALDAILLHRLDDGTRRADHAVLTLQWIQHLRRTIQAPLPSVPR
jgi:eukaryotic-like serine/threonine-protein kinase